MQVSARILGQEYGLSAKEMNYILLKNGILSGEPGNYELTEKGMKYAVEKNYGGGGNGGYSWFNPGWSTKTYDDSLKDVLDVSDEMIKEVRIELAARSAAQKSTRIFPDSVSLNAADVSENIIDQIDECTITWKKVAKTGLIIGGIIAISYGVYKLTPKVKAWWCARKQEQQGEGNDNENIQDQ